MNRNSLLHVEFVRSKDDDPMSLREHLTKHNTIFKALPHVLETFQIAMTFWASTAMCENSF